MSDHACSRVEPFQPAPGAWYGREMRARDDWIVNLDGASLEEVERAVAGVEARGLSILEIGRDDFPLPLLGPELRALSRELIDGRGFALIRGLPVGHLGRQRSAIAYWGMGRHLGEPITQNPLGHMLGHVKDIGADADDVDKRGYQSSAKLPYHTDVSGDFVALLCLKPSKSGGASSIVSSLCVHNEVLRRRPDLARVLARPYYMDRRGEVPEGLPPYYPLPVFNYHAHHLTVSYLRRFALSAQRFEAVPRFTEAQLEAMDLVDEIANEADVHLEMEFRQGDIQILNNLTILHARTAYVDHDDPAERRHLMRLWLSAEDGWPLPDVYYHRYGSAPGQGRPRGVHVRGTVPTAPLDVV